MLNRRLPRLALMLALAALPALSHALACKENGRDGQVLITEDIGSTVAVPVTLGEGEIIWHSSQRSVSVSCYKDHDGLRNAEDVFFYPNPRNNSAPQGVKFGVMYNGQAYFDPKQRIATGKTIPACPKKDYPDIKNCPTTDFNLDFQVVIATKPKYPGSGNVGVTQFEVMQFDGVGGINDIKGSNLVYKVTGLDKIRFIQCAVKVALNPASNTLDFGRITKTDKGLNPAVPRKDFSLSLEKTCDDPVKVNGYFRGVNGKVDDYTARLVRKGGDKDSGLGLQLFFGDGRKLRFDQSEYLADFRKGDRQRIVPMYGTIVPSNLGQVEEGPFTGRVNIDLDYL